MSQKGLSDVAETEFDRAIYCLGEAELNIENSGKYRLMNRILKDIGLYQAVNKKSLKLPLMVKKYIDKLNIQVVRPKGTYTETKIDDTEKRQTLEELIENAKKTHLPLSVELGNITEESEPEVTILYADPINIDVSDFREYKIEPYRISSLSNSELSKLTEEEMSRATENSEIAIGVDTINPNEKENYAILRVTDDEAKVSVTSLLKIRVDGNGMYTYLGASTAEYGFGNIIRNHELEENSEPETREAYEEVRQPEIPENQNEPQEDEQSGEDLEQNTN